MSKYTLVKYVFHLIGPLGRFDLVVAMYVHGGICLFVPFHVLDFEAYFSPHFPKTDVKNF